MNRQNLNEKIFFTILHIKVICKKKKFLNEKHNKKVK